MKKTVSVVKSIHDFEQTIGPSLSFTPLHPNSDEIGVDEIGLTLPTEEKRKPVPSGMYRVMSVDDSPVNFKLLNEKVKGFLEEVISESRTIEMQAFKLFSKADSSIRTTCHSLLILDYHLGKHDITGRKITGVDLYKIVRELDLKENHPPTPTLFVTSAPSIVVEALNAIDDAFQFSKVTYEIRDKQLPFYWCETTRVAVVEKSAEAGFSYRDVGSIIRELGWVSV